MWIMEHMREKANKAQGVTRMSKGLRVKPVTKPETIEREFLGFWRHYYGGQATTLDRENVEEFLQFITGDYRKAIETLKEQRVIEIWNPTWQWQCVLLSEERREWGRPLR